jgi:hypothetical protein
MGKLMQRHYLVTPVKLPNLAVLIDHYNICEQCFSDTLGSDVRFIDRQQPSWEENFMIDRIDIIPDEGF